MPNKLYPVWKQELIQGTSGTSLTGTLKCALVDTGTYTYSDSSVYYDESTSSDVQSATVGTPQTIGTKTYTDGVLDGDNITFTAVSGSTVEALVLYLDTGTPTTSRLVAYIDSSVTGLPVTPNGGDITVTWNASGIFAL